LIETWDEAAPADVDDFYLGASEIREFKRAIAERANVCSPVGNIVPYGNAVAPAGWLICDGSAISRTTYSDLFSVIGAAYGNGDGSTTFNLPDLRGRFIRGHDDGAGNDPDVGTRSAIAGGNTGDNVGSYQTDQYKQHNHGIANYVAGAAVTTMYLNTRDASWVDNYMSLTGAGDTRPENVYFKYIIRYAILIT